MYTEAVALSGKANSLIRLGYGFFGG